MNRRNLLAAFIGLLTGSLFRKSAPNPPNPPIVFDGCDEWIDYLRDVGPSTVINAKWAWTDRPADAHWHFICFHDDGNGKLEVVHKQAIQRTHV